jgi:hypothetical protein
METVDQNHLQTLPSRLPRGETGLKRALLGCILLIGVAPMPGMAQTPRPSPVGKVDTERFQSLLDSGNRLESAFGAGATPSDLLVLARDVQAEVALIKDPLASEAERLFISAMKAGAASFVAAAQIADASDDEARRLGVAETVTRFEVEAIPWASKEKFTILLDEGAGFLRAASRYYAGRIGDGLATEQRLLEGIATRRAARLKRGPRPR